MRKAVQRLMDMASALKRTIRESVPPLIDEQGNVAYHKAYELLSPEISEPWLVELAEEAAGTKIKAVNGFDVLDLADFYMQKQICPKCQNLDACRWKWYRLYFRVKDERLVADWVLCNRKYRDILINEIYEYADILNIKFSEQELQLKSIRELQKLRDQLRERVKARKRGKQGGASE